MNPIPDNVYFHCVALSTPKMAVSLCRANRAKPEGLKVKGAYIEGGVPKPMACRICTLFGDLEAGHIPTMTLDEAKRDVKAQPPEPVQAAPPVERPLVKSPEGRVHEADLEPKQPPKEQPMEGEKKISKAQQIRDWLGEHGPAACAEVADALGMEKKNTAAQLSGMIAHGLVEKSIGEDNINLYSLADGNQAPPAPEKEEPEQSNVLPLRPLDAPAPEKPGQPVKQIHRSLPEELGLSLECGLRDSLDDLRRHLAWENDGLGLALLKKHEISGEVLKLFLERRR